MSLRLVLVLTLVIALFSQIPLQSEASQTYKGKAVGIIISKSCQISPGCLKYLDIVYLDNSNKRYTGDFQMIDGDLKRISTSNQNNYRWLDFINEFTILVDPPLKFKNQIPLIEIVPALDEFHERGQMAITEYKPVVDAKATDSVRSYSHTRYVDSTCTNAKITAKNWKLVLPDTIDFLQHDCDPKHTTLKTIDVIIKPLYKHDIGTSSKSKLEKFYDSVKKECTKKRNACTDIKNRQVITMGDSR